MNAVDRPEGEAPDLWLEEVHGEAALAWVREHNARTEGELCARADYAEFRPRLKALMDARERIPYVSRIGHDFYNFWQDADPAQTMTPTRPTRCATVSRPIS